MRELCPVSGSTRTSMVIRDQLAGARLDHLSGQQLTPEFHLLASPSKSR